MQINLNINGSNSESEPAAEKMDLLETVKDEFHGIGRTHKESELDWLIERHCPDLLGNVDIDANSIIDRSLGLHKNCLLPHTLAIFGGWGSGKTHLLTEIGKNCRKRGLKVVYFNAFKYAAYMEIVPSLIYRILRIAKPDSGTQKLIFMANELAKQHRPFLYKKAVEFTKPIKLISTVPKTIQSERQLKKASEFFGKVDKFHATLHSELKNEVEPIFVLIDELDRCEPMEAFDIIKQLRILFCSSEVPLFFVVAVNPDPIGRTIQAKYSLDKSEDYESLRILEKFVDSVQFVTKNRSLSKFIESRWSAVGLDILQGTNMIAICARASGAFTLPRNTEHLPIYSNLRLLEKTMSTLAQDRKNDNHLWSRWHLLLIESMFPKFRAQIRKIAIEIADATDESVGAIVGPRLGGVMKERGVITFGIDYASISNFYTRFKSNLMRQTQHMDHEKEEIIKDVCKDSEKLAMLAQLCFLDITSQLTVDVEATGERKISECLNGVESQLRSFSELLRASN